MSITCSKGAADVLASDLAVTEVVSALSRRWREGALSAADAFRVQRGIVVALEDGIYRHVDLSREVHRHAERFLLTLREVALRSADALHLALAVSAGAGSVLTFDARLSAAAGAVGLPAYPDTL